MMDERDKTGSRVRFYKHNIEPIVLITLPFFLGLIQ